MPANNLKEYLDNQHVKYEAIEHSPAFTAQETAASAHVSGKKFAKTVIVTIDDKFAMVVLPAHDHVSFAALKNAVGGNAVDLASEGAFKAKFSGCDVGAMPPFGNLYDMPVYVSSELTRLKDITFCAGTHAELMRMDYKDFERLVKPKVIAVN